MNRFYVAQSERGSQWFIRERRSKQIVRVLYSHEKAVREAKKMDMPFRKYEE